VLDHGRQNEPHAVSHFLGSPFQDPVTALGELMERSVVKSPPMRRQQMVVEDIDDDSRVAPQMLRQTGSTAAKKLVLVGEQICLLVQPNAPQNAIRNALLPATLEEIRQNLADDVIFVFAG